MMSANLYRSTFVYACTLVGTFSALLLTCTKSESQPSEPPRGQSPQTSGVAPEKKESAVTNEPMESVSDHVELDVAGVKMRITLDDGKAIKAALLRWLRKSDLGDKELLIKVTKPAPVYVSVDSCLQIGRWCLMSDEGKLSLYARWPITRIGATAYRAYITKEKEVWRVLSVSRIHILPRRSPPRRR